MTTTTASENALAVDLIARAWGCAFSEPESSRDWAAQALDVSAGVEDAATSFWLLAAADWQLDRQETVHTHLRLSRTLFVQLESPRGQALCAELDAAIALQSGDAIRASLIHRALDAAPDPGSRAIDRFFSRWQRGVFARLLGQHDKALDHFRTAVDSAEASRNPGALAVAQLHLGGLLLELGRIEPAVAHTEAARSLAQHASARTLATAASAQLIVLRHAQGRPADVVDLAQAIGDQGGTQGAGPWVRLAVPLALAFWVAGDLDRAEAWLESGSSSQALLGDNAVFWAWVSARCLLSRGEHGLARDLAERTLAARQARSLPYHLGQLMTVAADACEAAGDRAAEQRHRLAASALVSGSAGSPRVTMAPA
jgi:tetratricopeptide (TPR) repeat protein